MTIYILSYIFAGIACALAVMASVFKAKADRYRSGYISVKAMLTEAVTELAELNGVGFGEMLDRLDREKIRENKEVIGELYK